MRSRWHDPQVAHEHAHGDHEQKDALINRLHRIEGQVRGIEKMAATDRYCIDVLTQIAAVSTALESLGFQILDEHVKHCVAGEGRGVARGGAPLREDPLAGGFDLDRTLTSPTDSA